MCALPIVFAPSMNVQVIKEVKKDHGEEMQVKGLTKEGVIEPVTAADNLSNKVGW